MAHRLAHCKLTAYHYELQLHLRGMLPQEVADLDSGRPMPESLFKTFAVYFVTNVNPVYKGHTGKNNSFSHVGKPNQTLGLASIAAVAM